MTNGPLLRVYLAFEPGYRMGFIVTVGSLAAHASQAIAVDVLTRPEHRPALEGAIAHLSALFADRIDFRVLEIPDEIVEYCKGFTFGNHFTPEILYRLFYFDLSTDEPDRVLYLDTDIIVVGDVYGILEEPLADNLLVAAKEPLPAHAPGVFPAGVGTYLNSGVLLFRSRPRSAVLAAMHDVRALLPVLNGRTNLLDQDALAIALTGRMGDLAHRWNFTTKRIGIDDVNRAVILHATGSRKPWHIFGGHPFSPQYERARKAAGLGLAEAYDLAWPLRKLARRIRQWRRPATPSTSGAR